MLDTKVKPESNLKNKKDNYYILRNRLGKKYALTGPFFDKDYTEVNLINIITNDIYMLNLGKNSNNAIYTVSKSNKYEIIYIECPNKETLEKGLEYLNSNLNTTLEELKTIEYFKVIEVVMSYEIINSEDYKKWSKEYYTHIVFYNNERKLNEAKAVLPFLNYKTYDDACAALVQIATEESKKIIPKQKDSYLRIDASTAQMGEIRIYENVNGKDELRNIIVLFPVDAVCDVETKFYT